jgi:hypothetical protein
VTFRKKIYASLDELQKTKTWMIGLLITITSELVKEKCASGRTPIETFSEGKKIWQEKV